MELLGDSQVMTSGIDLWVCEINPTLPTFWTIMSVPLSLLVLSAVTLAVKGERLGGGADSDSQPLLSTLSKKRNREDIQLFRGGREFSDQGQAKANFFSRPSLPLPKPSSGYDQDHHLPSSNLKPSPLESLSNLVTQGLGVFGGSNPTISLPGLTSSLAGILQEGLGLAQTFPHAGGFSRVDSLVSLQ